MYKPLREEIVSVLVLNQANVLTRVVSMFGRRGFNIDSLTVSPTADPSLSRITIVFSATEQSMQQIITQTEKLEVVKEVVVLSRENSIYRELVLMRIECGLDKLTTLKAIVETFRGKIVDLSRDGIVVELTGTPHKINGFLDAISEYSITHMTRTGITAIEGINDDKGEQE
ncbi:MAG: acetolactate synthase small subunit [Mogibacterium sp.]|nr:acetolactate synthase small subunit [Mogibacterium sp.]